MTKPNLCESCGGPLPATGILGGRCPRCLVEQALETTVGIQDLAKTLPATPLEGSAAGHHISVGRYRVLRVIGQGGMGVVYEAEQELPRRTVALKIIKPGMMSAETIRRFELEAQALGKLQHPGIAQIHEAGTADTGFGPQPYFAMELIHGLTPRDYVAMHKLGIRERLELVAKTSEAVHHAHQRGLIHRDLKPSNILIDETGQPKVLDFGVARAIDGDAQATHDTNVGQLVGTLAYMSPEQVLSDPHEVDIRTDIYALGIILYELLAGHLPYNTNRKLPEALETIRQEDAAPLGTINRECRGDIETIVAKALEKDKTRRYTSAAELAADIRRYLTDQPITARPPTATYQLKKFARRNRALVVGAGAVFTVLMLGVISSSWEASRATQAEQAAVRERDRARQAEILVGQERDRAISAEAAATIQRNLALETEKRALVDRDRAISAETQMREDRNRTTWQNLSRESIRLSSSRSDDDLAALLARQALLLEKQALHASQSTLVENALQQASRASNWSHRVYQIGETDIRMVVFSPDGTHLVSNGPDGSIAIWDMRRPGSPPQYLKGQPGLGPVLFAAFSPDGTQLATGGYEGSGARGNALNAAPIKIWDLRQSNPFPTLLQGHPREVHSGSYFPDGKRLVTTDTQSIRLWDLKNPASPSIVFQSVQLGIFYISLAISPDGTRLVSPGNDGIRMWDMRNPGVPATILQKSENGLLAVFSPDGKLLACAARDGVRLWDLQNPGAPQVLLQGPQVLTVAFSPDGKTLAAGSVDGVIRLWQLRNREASPLLLRGHQGAVGSVAFSPDGTRLASGGNDKTVRIWELQSPGAPLVLAPSIPGARGGVSQFVAFSLDGNRLFDGSQDSSVRSWDLRNANALAILLQTIEGQTTSNVTRSVAFSHDSSRVAIDLDGGTRVWSLRNPLDPPIALPAAKSLDKRTSSLSPVMALALSPDGSQLAQGIRATGPTGTIMLWDLKDRRSRSLSLPASPQIAYRMAYSPDGSHLAAANQLEVRIWNLRKPESEPLMLTRRQSRPIIALAFSPDGGSLAVGAEDTLVWNLKKSGAPPLLLPGYIGFGVESLDFSPDGLRLAAGTLANVTQLWDLRNPTSPPVQLPSGGNSVAFSSNGQKLAVGGLDGSVRLWTLGSAAADYLCTRVWRNLSMDEWRLYVGEGIRYERTCPELPHGAGDAATTK